MLNASAVGRVAGESVAARSAATAACDAHAELAHLPHRARHPRARIEATAGAANLADRAQDAVARADAAAARAALARGALERLAAALDALSANARVASEAVAFDAGAHARATQATRAGGAGGVVVDRSVAVVVDAVAGFSARLVDHAADLAAAFARGASLAAGAHHPRVARAARVGAEHRAAADLKARNRSGTRLIESSRSSKKAV